MKYKIIKKESKYLQNTLKSNDNGKPYYDVEIVHNIWYEGRRKGRIFGFWHNIGHESYYWGDRWSYRGNSVEAIENYIHKYHEVHYGDMNKCEIIKTINI